MALQILFRKARRLWIANSISRLHTAGWRPRALFVDESWLFSSNQAEELLRVELNKLEDSQQLVSQHFVDSSFLVFNYRTSRSLPGLNCRECWKCHGSSSFQAVCEVLIWFLWKKKLHFFRWRCSNLRFHGLIFVKGVLFITYSPFMTSSGQVLTPRSFSNAFFIALQWFSNLSEIFFPLSVKNFHPE